MHHRIKALEPLPETDAAQFPVSRLRIYAIFLVVNFFSAIPRYFLVPERGIIFHLSLYIATVGWAVLTWEFIVSIGRVLEKRLPLASNFLSRCIIQTVLTYPVVTLLGDGMFSAASSIFNIPLNPSLVTIGYLLYFLMTLVLNLIYFGIAYFFNWKKELINLGGIQREQAIVKYNSVRNQLNPHFLFNALSSLNSLIFENQQLASDFLQQLSKVYRYVLQNKDKETVTVSTEIDFISHYITLLKIRYGTAIEFHIGLNDTAMERQIVPVTIQILIENAIKHNVVSIKLPLKISIATKGDYLIVENNIIRKPIVESSNKQGLNNLVTFYKYLSINQLMIEETKNSFKVNIPLI
jgi:two-component system, LytTR family, sensor kinase